jgi:hypothetical protein
LSVSTERAGALDRVSVLVLAAAFSTIDALFRKGVADGLGQAALAYLAADEVVDAVLEVVDL